MFEQCRNDIFLNKYHLKAFLWEGCWELCSFKHYYMSYNGTCGESCYRNQACCNQKDKYEDGNLKCALALLTAAKKKGLFSHQSEMLQAK